MTQSFVEKCIRGGGHGSEDNERRMLAYACQWRKLTKVPTQFYSLSLDEKKKFYYLLKKLGAEFDSFRKLLPEAIVCLEDGNKIADLLCVTMKKDPEFSREILRARLGCDGRAMLQDWLFRFVTRPSRGRHVGCEYYEYNPAFYWHEVIIEWALRANGDRFWLDSVVYDVSVDYYGIKQYQEICDAALVRMSDTASCFNQYAEVYKNCQPNNPTRSAMKSLALSKMRECGTFRDWMEFPEHGTESDHVLSLEECDRCACTIDECRELLDMCSVAYCYKGIGKLQNSVLKSCLKRIYKSKELDPAAWTDIIRLNQSRDKLRIAKLGTRALAMLCKCADA